MNTNGAEWHVIPGFSRYEITREGEVRDTHRGRSMPHHHVRGYPALGLKNDDGVRKNPYLHTLMLITFVGPKGPGEVCRHLDGNKLNWSLDNLTWGTETENNYDRVRHGTHPMAIKTHCPKGHPYDEACLICNRARARAASAARTAARREARAA